MAEQSSHLNKQKNQQQEKPTALLTKINLKNQILKKKHNNSASETKVRKVEDNKYRRRSVASLFTKNDKGNDCINVKDTSDRQFLFFHHSLTPSTSASAATSVSRTVSTLNFLKLKRKKSAAALVLQRKGNVMSAPVHCQPVFQNILLNSFDSTTLTLNESCCSIPETKNFTPSSASSLQKPLLFKKPCSVASTIRSTLRPSSLASIVLAKRSSGPLENKQNYLYHKDSNSSILDNDLQTKSSYNNSTPNEKLDKKNEEHDNFEDNIAKFNNINTTSNRHNSSHMKKNMKKHFFNAKIALRKLSLSSNSIGHNLTQLPQSSASAIASPCSLQTSAGVSPINDFSYFSEKIGELNWDCTIAEENYDKRKLSSQQKSSISRVFRKKSVTAPTIKRMLGPSLSWDPEQRFVF